jgi:hypothetical protein
MLSKNFLLVAIIVLLAIVASEGRRQRRNLFTSRATRFPRRRLITWKGAGKLVRKGVNVYKKVKPIVNLLLDEEDDHRVGGWGRKAACIGAACLMMVNKGAMPPRKYNGYNNPIAPIHRGVDMMMDEEDDHRVGGWGRKAACIGAACLMMVNKGAMPPRKYNGYNNPIAPIHRGVDMMMDEHEDENVGSDELGCYLFPRAPKCRGWDMLNDDDDVGVHAVGGTRGSYLRRGAFRL